MQIRIRSRKDFYSGLIFLGFGLAAVWFARGYRMGTPQKMGPGFAPTVLGWLLAGLGLAVTGVSLSVDGPSVTRFATKPVLLVLASVVAFALIVRPAGLVASTLALIFVSALAGHDFRLGEVLLSAAILAAGCVALFVYGLKLQFKIWPW